MNDFVTKPFRPDQLLEVMLEWASVRQHRADTVKQLPNVAKHLPTSALTSHSFAPPNVTNYGAENDDATGSACYDAGVDAAMSLPMSLPRDNVYVQQRRQRRRLMLGSVWELEKSGRSRRLRGRDNGTSDGASIDKCASGANKGIGGARSKLRECKTVLQEPHRKREGSADVETGDTGGNGNDVDTGKDVHPVCEDDRKIVDAFECKSNREYVCTERDRNCDRNHDVAAAQGFATAQSVATAQRVATAQSAAAATAQSVAAVSSAPNVVHRGSEPEQVSDASDRVRPDAGADTPTLVQAHCSFSQPLRAVVAVGIDMDAVPVSLPTSLSFLP